MNRRELSEGISTRSSPQGPGETHLVTLRRNTSHIAEAPICEGVLTQYRPVIPYRFSWSTFLISTSFCVEVFHQLEERVVLLVQLCPHWPCRTTFSKQLAPKAVDRPKGR